MGRVRDRRARTRRMLTLNPTLMETTASQAGGFLAQAQAGDAEAFGEVCRAYEIRLLRQAMALCGSASLAEDLVQDTLVEAWKCLRRYNGRCQFYTWLCAILLNRYRNTIRQKRPMPFSTFRRDDQEELHDGICQLADQESLPDEAAQRREQAALVQQCIQALSESFHRRLVSRLRAEQPGSLWRTLAAPFAAARLNWRIAVPVAGVVALVIAMLSFLVRQHAVAPLAPAGMQAVAPPALKSDLPPTIANYRRVANHSLDELDELLTRQANRNPSPAPIYTASIFALTHAAN